MLKGYTLSYSMRCAKVSEAVCLDVLSYHEAWELSYFGANVLHPRTTLPAMKHGWAHAQIHQPL